METTGPKVESSGATDRETVQILSGPGPDTLFSKPANAEQYEIAARLAKSKAVLVQGPPGTGKTHTIANLLGCLLAQGKTVLVTAHTTKALRVLRDKVDDVLKPLCLSVLDSDADSHDQLKLAAQEIASRLSTSDAVRLRRDAAMLREKRTKFLAAEQALQRKLRDARFSEVEEVVIGGEALSAIEVAKRVKAGMQADGSIPGPLQPGILCPLAEPSHLGTKRSSRHPNQHSRNLSRRRTFAYSPQRRRARMHARKRIARNSGLTTPGGISRRPDFNSSTSESKRQQRSSARKSFGCGKCSSRVGLAAICGRLGMICSQLQTSSRLKRALRNA